MGSKLRPGKFDCHRNALPDEPMFIVLARDPDAASIVRLWAGMRARRIKAGERPDADEAMVDEAMQCAADMDAWRAENEGVWRQVVPTGSRLVPAPWRKDEQILVSFEGGAVTVNGKKAGDNMSADESTVLNEFSNRLFAT